jgi:hypothetical protein
MNGEYCCNIEVLKKLSRCGDVMMELKASEYKRFEDIKHVRNDGTEYWSARKLAPTLEYI